MMGCRLLSPLVVALGCLALTACGSTPEASDGSAAFYRPDPEGFYPTGTAFGSYPPPEAPACLRAAELGFGSEHAFADCRRELEVYEAVLRVWSKRIADVVADEASRNSERALATLTCKLNADGGCEPVGYGTKLLTQPRPPACVGHVLPIAPDDGGPSLENCRYGVTQYGDSLAEWAQRAAYEARLEAEVRLEAAIGRFNCKLLAEPWRGVPCFSGERPPVTARYASR